MASEFGIEVPVKQPPALTVPSSKRDKAGARMNKRRVAFSNQQRVSAKKQGRAAAGAHRGFMQMQKGRLGSIRQAHRANLSSIRASNQGIRAHKAAIRMHMKKQRAASPRYRARQVTRARNTALKFSNLLYLARLAKKAFAKKKMDGRNHGAKGVNSGKFRTGRAGVIR